MHPKTFWSWLIADFLRFLRALLWPILVLILILNFKDEIKVGITRVREVSAGGATLKIGPLFDSIQTLNIASMQVESQSNALLDSIAKPNLDSNKRMKLAKEIQLKSKELAALEYESLKLSKLIDVIRRGLETNRVERVLDKIDYTLTPLPLNEARKEQVREIVESIGVDRVNKSTPDGLKLEFDLFLKKDRESRSQVYSSIPNMELLQSVGVVEDVYSLTPYGIDLFKSIAYQLKSGKYQVKHLPTEDDDE